MVSWLLNRKSHKMRFHLRFQLCILMISFRFAATEAPNPPPLCAPNAAVFLQLNRIFAQLQFSHFPIAPNQVVKIFIWANRFLMVCHFN